MNYEEGVTFIVLRPDGKILMQKRDGGGGDKVIPYPHMWCFPGGGKEKGESHVEAVVREVKEEFDLIVEPEECELILSNIHGENIQDKVFVCRVRKDVKPELHEGEAMKWMSFKEIKDLSLAWEQNKILPEIEEKLSGVTENKKSRKSLWTPLSPER